MHSAQKTNRLISLVRQNPSAMGTVLANLVPVMGVLFFGWDAFTVVFLYWLENGVIGFFNVLKMALARSEIETVGDLLEGSPFGLSRRFTKQVPEQVMKQWASQPAPKIPGGLKFFLIPFFIVHYSGFMGVHLVFILVLLGPGQSLIGQTGVSPSSLFDFGISTWGLASLAIALISLVIEHGYAFYKDYWLSGEYRRAVPAALMFKPYPRIVVLHLAILFGGFLFVFFGLPPLMVVLLVALKVGLELRQLLGAKVSAA